MESKEEAYDSFLEFVFDATKVNDDMSFDLGQFCLTVCKLVNSS